MQTFVNHIIITIVIQNFDSSKNLPSTLQHLRTGQIQYNMHWRALLMKCNVLGLYKKAYSGIWLCAEIWINGLHVTLT